MSKNKLILCGFLFALAWGICLWPTLYRYEKVQTQSREIVYRINRITGKPTLIIPTNPSGQ